MSRVTFADAVRRADGSASLRHAPVTLMSQYRHRMVWVFWNNFDFSSQAIPGHVASSNGGLFGGLLLGGGAVLQTRLGDGLVLWLVRGDIWRKVRCTAPAPPRAVLCRAVPGQYRCCGYPRRGYLRLPLAAHRTESSRAVIYCAGQRV